jgi:thiol-disulfide isomerase/thioredoxin
MKNIILIFLAIISMSCNSKKFSDKALATTLLSENNKQIAFNEILKKHIGHIVLIEVWAGWCSDCVKNMPNLKKLQANHPTVDFLFISMDKTSDKWKEAIAKHEIVGDHFMANDGMKGFFGTAMGIDWIPRYIILNKKGEIELLRAIETDFDKVNETLSRLE